MTVRRRPTGMKRYTLGTRRHTARRGLKQGDTLMRNSRFPGCGAWAAATVLALGVSCASDRQPAARPRASSDSAAPAEASSGAPTVAAAPTFECRFADGAITIDGKAD